MGTPPPKGLAKMDPFSKSPLREVLFFKVEISNISMEIKFLEVHRFIEESIDKAFDGENKIL